MIKKLTNERLNATLSLSKGLNCICFDPKAGGHSMTKFVFNQ